MDKLVRKYIPLMLIIVFILLMQASFVGAAARDGLAFTVGCAGFTTNDGGFWVDRDNTGTDHENLYIVAEDAVGNVIYGPVEVSIFSGGRFYFVNGMSFKWTSAPTTNPLMVSLYSAAGNGLDEQLVYSASGSCADLPTATIQDEVVDGSVSPSAGLNETPPEGANPDGTGEMRSGHLIVNVEWANLRSGDGVEYTEVGRVRGGIELIVLGVNEDRAWWYVAAGDLRGWISNELVIVRGDLRGTPISPVMGELEPPRLFVYLDNALYRAPAKGGGAICIIEGQREYLVVGQSSSGLSIVVEAICNGETVMGWLPAEVGGLRNAGAVDIPVMR